MKLSRVGPSTSRASARRVASVTDSVTRSPARRSRTVSTGTSARTASPSTVSPSVANCAIAAWMYAPGGGPELDSVPPATAATKLSRPGPSNPSASATRLTSATLRLDGSPPASACTVLSETPASSADVGGRGDARRVHRRLHVARDLRGAGGAIGRGGDEGVPVGAGQPQSIGDRGCLRHGHGGRGPTCRRLQQGLDGGGRHAGRGRQ